MMGWVIKLHTFQYVSMNFDATVCHFEGFTSKTTNSAVFWGVFFCATKSSFGWKPSTVPGEAGHAEVDAALKLLTSPEGIQEWFPVKRLGNDQRGNWDLGFLDADGWMEDVVFKGVESANIEEHRWRISIWDEHLELPCLLCRESDRKRCSVAVASTCGSGVRHSVSELWVSWYGGRSHEQWAKWSNPESTPTWP